ncbi:hypothetical protein WN944_027560 [Citrus x changshan-huyou]|uniref:F-box domain-containing protein n=1 Tax=Citrus x changshan-huyou TaxID=2935761 RepID=A0AAP0LHR3_9ROSI
MSIPLDVITEILSLLPVKSLLRFRCVSKQLCASIDSPEFVKLHLSRSKETYSKSSLILELRSGFFSANLDSLDIAVQLLDHPLDGYPEKTVEVIGCCNGLLALKRYWRNEVYLLNPSTKKHRLLPDIVIDSESHDNNSGIDRFGFGYDASTDDYKLVRIIMSSKQVFVYSLKTNSWKRVQDFSYHDSFPIRLKGGGSLVGGALNWAKLKWNCHALLITAFDLKNENFFVVPLPDDMTNEKSSFTNFRNLSVLGGCLSVTCVNRTNINDCYDVWVMKEYGIKESWTKLFSFPWSPKESNLKTIAYSKCGNKVLLRPEPAENSYFCWYDLKEQTSHEFQITGLPLHYWREPTVCLESLVSPHGNIYQTEERG